MIGLDFLKQFRLMRDGGDAGLALQRRGDLDKLLFQRSETLGLFGAESSGRGQRRDLVEQLVAGRVVEGPPGVWLFMLFDRAAMLADDEVIENDQRNFLFNGGPLGLNAEEGLYAFLKLVIAPPRPAGRLVGDPTAGEVRGVAFMAAVELSRHASRAASNPSTPAPGL